MSWISLGSACAAGLQEARLRTASHYGVPWEERSWGVDARAFVLEDVVMLQVPTDARIMTVFGST